MPEPVENGDFVETDAFEDTETSAEPESSSAVPGPGAEDSFEDEDIEGSRPAIEVRRCPRCGEIVDEQQQNCRRCGLALRPAEPPPPTPVRADMAEPAQRVLMPGQDRSVPGPQPQAAQPPAGMPSPAARGPPPADAASNRPLPRPAAPPKPELRSFPPEQRKALRERFMVKGSRYLVALGVADAVVWAVPLLWTNLYINLGMCIANFVIIGGVLLNAQPHLDVGRAEMSEPEKKHASNVLIGLGIIMIVPIHEVLGIFPLGYYSPSWSSYGPLGLVNPVIMLVGAMMAAFNIQQSRERMGYFTIWRNGALVLLLAPVFSLVQVGLPILAYPEWFHETVGLMGGTVMGIAFVLKNQRDKQFSEMENAMRWGDELAARGQLEQAIVQYDSAINMAHTLYSHLIFNPDSPYLSVRVPPAYSEPWFRKGRALARLQRHKKALAIFDMIVEMDPINQIALLNEAEIMTEMGDFPGALGAVDRVLKIVPDHPDALRMRLSIAAAARRAAEDAERAEDAEMVFKSASGRAPPAAPAKREFLDA